LFCWRTGGGRGRETRVEGGVLSVCPCQRSIALQLLQDLADDEGVGVVQASDEGCFVPLAGPDALDGVDDAPDELEQVVLE
jgi:hypothetical protein